MSRRISPRSSNIDKASFSSDNETEEQTSANFFEQTINTNLELMSKEEGMGKLANNQFQIKNSENTRLIVGWIRSVEDSKTEIQQNFKGNISSLENSIEETRDHLSRLKENDIKKVNELSQISKELDKIKSDQKEKFNEIRRYDEQLEELTDRILKLETNLNTLMDDLKSSIDGLKQETHSKLRGFQEAIVKLNTKFESAEEKFSKMNENIDFMAENINSLRQDLSDSENKLKSDLDGKLEKVQKKFNLNEPMEDSPSKMNTPNGEDNQTKKSSDINSHKNAQKREGEKCIIV